MSASFIAVNENEWQPFYSGTLKDAAESQFRMGDFGFVANENDVSFID